jgi:Fur family transcriptional regulator, ferric uptake regulator
MAARSKYVTQPREKIAKILQSKRRYLSASDIHDQLRKGRTKVALSTVYRTLEHLMESGEVSERVDDAGRKSYVACDASHHHHAICRTCGSIQDVACPELIFSQEALRSRYGFDVDAHAVEFFGRCKVCRAS